VRQALGKRTGKPETGESSWKEKYLVGGEGARRGGRNRKARDGGIEEEPEKKLRKSLKITEKRENSDNLPGTP